MKTQPITNVETYLSKGQMLNVWLSVSIIVLVVIIIADNVRVWFKLLVTDKPTGLNDGRDQVFCPVIPADAPPDVRP